MSAVEAGKIKDVRRIIPSQNFPRKSAKKAKKERELAFHRMRAEILSRKLSRDHKWVDLGRRARELEEFDKDVAPPPTRPP